MKKRIITVAGIAACLALWAAVWPQKQPAEETPALPTPVAVIATQHEVPKMPEMKEVITPEEEKAEATLPALVEETDMTRNHRLLKRPQRAKYRLPLNRMPHPHKNQNLPRLYLTALRTIRSMCRASAG